MCFHLNEQFSPLLQKVTNKNFKNYPPVSLLPICRKNLKDSYSMKCLKFFLANNLLAPNQSGFKQGDPCINELLSIITHEIYSTFDDGFEVRNVFLIYLKPSIKFGIKGLYLNFSKTVFWMTCWISYLIF